MPPPTPAPPCHPPQKDASPPLHELFFNALSFNCSRPCTSNARAWECVLFAHFSRLESNCTPSAPCLNTFIAISVRFCARPSRQHALFLRFRFLCCTFAHASWQPSLHARVPHPTSLFSSRSLLPLRQNLDTRDRVSESIARVAIATQDSQ
jgi:hypothetical protein